MPEFSSDCYPNFQQYQKQDLLFLSITDIEN
jgi:hypothetical protein